MSRLIKKPVKLPQGVTMQDDGDFLIFKGPGGEKKLKSFPGVSVRIEGDNIWVEKSKKATHNKAIYGTAWSIIGNCILGVTEGFSKVLEIEGVGYRASMEGKDLVLSLGYANLVRFSVPEDVKVEVEKNSIKISGIDKELVGHVAAEIRSLKKPEPYKGKGIRYRGEVVRRKAGKKAASATAGAE